MNTYYINDEDFINSDIYKDFLKENPVTGNLRIRAYAANQALPISGIRVVVSKEFDNNTLVFFDGFTDDSGLIERLSLPAPKLDSNDMNVPNKATYDITATYVTDNITTRYKVNIYENVCVVQNIVIVPEMNKIGDA